MLSMSNELRLVLTLVINEEEVPENLKKAAVDELRILGMHFGEGTAELYLVEMIADAVQKEDADALAKVGELVGKVFGKEDIDPIQSDGNVRELSRTSLETCEKFVAEDDGKKRMAIVSKLTREGIMPMYYEHGFMLLYIVEHDTLIAASVNGAYEDHDALLAAFEGMPTEVRTDLMDRLKRLSGVTAYEIRFGELRYHEVGEGQITMLLKEM